MLYAQSGITTAHEGATHLPQFQTMKRAAEAGANIIDVIAFPFVTDAEKIKNPLKVDPLAIKDIKVVETIKEGQTIYKAS